MSSAASLLPILTSPAARLLVVAAHPDDETVGLGGTLARRAALARRVTSTTGTTRIVVVTDGAPRAPSLRAAGFADASREAYAEMRRLELARALRLVDLGPEDVDQLDFVDQEAALHLEPLARRLTRIFAAYAPDVVVTHPYEGGHPDHDACAFAVRLAIRVLREGVGRTPELLVEMGSYHTRLDPRFPGELVAQRFLDGNDEDVLELDEDSAEIKAEMFAAHASQARVLSAFRADVEALRVAPDVSFTRPPHPGEVHYERLGWTMSTATFVDLARAAARALGCDASVSTAPPPARSGFFGPGTSSVRRRDQLTVVSVPYTLAHVGTATSGGAEQVLAMLDEALVEEGHRSIVLAPEGSRVRGEFVTTAALAPPYDDAARGRMRAVVRDLLVDLLSRERVDVVHFHGLDFGGVFPPEEGFGVPCLVTMHLSPSAYPGGMFTMTREDVWLVPVSTAQASACPPSPRLLPPIPNGVPTSTLLPNATPDDYALVLGRVCREKGVDVAIRAAAHAGMPSVIAGPVLPYPEHVAYFDEEIAPLLGGTNRYVGPLQGRDKSARIGRARVLVVASRVPETSSLVAMEAIASGTPVAALDVGALSEIVEEGVTGALAPDADALPEAILRASRLDRHRCRQIGLLSFDAGTMITRYIELYEQLARGWQRRRTARSSSGCA